MDTERKIDLQVGIFVFLGLLMITISILFIGAERAILQRNYNLFTKFPDIFGLQTGAKVRLAGLEVGRVTNITFPKELKETRVYVRLTIDQKVKRRIREDSIVSIKTLGVLGDKYLSITPGSEQAAILAEGAFLKSEETADVEDYLRKGGKFLDNAVEITQSLKTMVAELEKEKKIEKLVGETTSAAESLNKFLAELEEGKLAENLQQTSAKLSSILDKIDSGKGTIGALVNDPVLYDNVKGIFEGADRNKLLQKIIRQGIKKQDEVRVRHDLP
ncbi:MAG: MCE family protein [Deltaproteobacteria bacterium]|nr:MCE family protein [Deltaproteobacteria bacterium]